MTFGTLVLRKGLDDEVYFCMLPETPGSSTARLTRQDAPRAKEDGRKTWATEQACFKEGVGPSHWETRQEKGAEEARKRSNISLRQQVTGQVHDPLFVVCMLNEEKGSQMKPV